MPLFPRQLRRQEYGAAEPMYLTNIRHWWEKTGIAPIYTSATWSTANLAVYTPITLEDVRKTRGVMLLLGATPSGLVQLALYAPDSEGKPGLRLAQTQATVQSASYPNEFQLITWDSPYDVDGIWLDRGTYFLACVFNNTSGTVTRLVALTTDGHGPIMGGIFTEADAYPLPAVATPNKLAVTVNVPIMGLHY